MKRTKVTNCMNEETIAIEELKQKMNEICQKCPDGKSEWCGDCHFDELAEVLGIELYWQGKKNN